MNLFSRGEYSDRKLNVKKERQNKIENTAMVTAAIFTHTYSLVHQSKFNVTVLISHWESYITVVKCIVCQYLFCNMKRKTLCSAMEFKGIYVDE